MKINKPKFFLCKLSKNRALMRKRDSANVPYIGYTATLRRFFQSIHDKLRKRGLNLIPPCDSRALVEYSRRQLYYIFRPLIRMTKPPQPLEGRRDRVYMWPDKCLQLSSNLHYPLLSLRLPESNLSL